MPAWAQATSWARATTRCWPKSSPSRPTAPPRLARLDAALAATAVVGLTTNRGFLRWLIGRPDVQAAEMDTELIDREWSPAADEVPPEAWPAASAALAATNLADQPLVGFRLNQPAQVRIDIDDEQRPVPVGTATNTGGWPPKRAWCSTSMGAWFGLASPQRRHRKLPSAMPPTPAARRWSRHPCRVRSWT